MRVVACCVVVLAAVSWADSPITSTDFATAYMDVEAVRAAKGMEALEGAPLELLLSSAPNDQKLAVVSQLGWGKGFGPQFLARLEKARGFDAEKVGPLKLAPADAFVLGYLEAEDDYFELKAPRPGGKGLWAVGPLALVKMAAQALPDDFAVQYAAAVVQVQQPNTDWCQIFKVPEAVVKRFPPGKRNLRPGALEAARGYLQAYEESCPGSKAAAQKGKEELNQIYTVSRLGTQVITGTQGGVVVWQPPSPTPVMVREGFICKGLVVGDLYWAACRDGVFKWDGTQFKAYQLEKKGRDADYVTPMKGPGGAVWVRHGAKTFAWDAARDAFVPVKAPWSGDPYGAIVRSTGEVCWVEFLKAVHCAGQTMPLSSAAYPGSDPREFDEGADGTLWVEDFDSGIFKLGADGRFTHQEGLNDKGTGVAWDAKSQRLYLLHYTNGLEVLRAGKPRIHVGAETLQYVRAMMLDPDGTVWLGGETQLQRLSPDGEAFGKTSFRVR